VLPYRASIDAAVDRFTADLDPAPGREKPDIGVVHATAAQTLLTRATADGRRLRWCATAMSCSSRWMTTAIH
ncbi:MAG: hypothetical protein ACRDTF_07510, partial [Pseudonocardiaceae bacterium]